MTKYMVVGGVFTDTDFKELADKSKGELYGPFDTYKEAYVVWASNAWRNVDTCCHRLCIVETE